MNYLIDVSEPFEFWQLGTKDIVTEYCWSDILRVGFELALLFKDSQYVKRIGNPHCGLRARLLLRKLTDEDLEPTTDDIRMSDFFFDHFIFTLVGYYDNITSIVDPILINDSKLMNRHFTILRIQ